MGGPRNGTLSTYLDWRFSGLRCDPVDWFGGDRFAPMMTWHVYRLIDLASASRSMSAALPFRKIDFRVTSMIQHWRHDQGAKSFAALVCIPK